MLFLYQLAVSADWNTIAHCQKDSYLDKDIPVCSLRKKTILILWEGNNELDSVLWCNGKCFPDESLLE